MSSDNYLIVSLEKGKIILLDGSNGNLIKMLWSLFDKTVKMVAIYETNKIISS